MVLLEVGTKQGVVNTRYFTTPWYEDCSSSLCCVIEPFWTWEKDFVFPDHFIKFRSNSEPRWKARTFWHDCNEWTFAFRNRCHKRLESFHYEYKSTSNGHTEIIQETLSRRDTQLLQLASSYHQGRRSRSACKLAISQPPRLLRDLVSLSSHTRSLCLLAVFVYQSCEFVRSFSNFSNEYSNFRSFVSPLVKMRIHRCMSGWPGTIAIVIKLSARYHAKITKR